MNWGNIMSPLAAGDVDDVPICLLRRNGVDPTAIKKEGRLHG
ncbi:MAG TPA: hypothetical protein VL049_24110 [Candidatus Dormibacteraeota bacterium]|nr:hypothetical protein [Candidatus Dormibacteraeota bacterium]